MIYDDVCGVKHGQLIFASKAVSARRFAHLDLTALAIELEERDGRPSLDRYCARLDELGGSLTSVFIDPLDPRPGEQGLSDLSSRFGWQPDAAREAIMSRLDHDV